MFNSRYHRKRDYDATLYDAHCLAEECDDEIFWHHGKESKILAPQCALHHSYTWTYQTPNPTYGTELSDILCHQKISHHLLECWNMISRSLEAASELHDAGQTYIDAHLKLTRLSCMLPGAQVYFALGRYEQRACWCFRTYDMNCNIFKHALRHGSKCY